MLTKKSNNKKEEYIENIVNDKLANDSFLKKKFSYNKKYFKT